MTTLSRSSLVVLAFLALATLPAPAQTSGSYSNDCGGIVKLWDFSGNYFEDNGIETESLTLSMDGNGIVTGTGQFDLTDDSDSVYLHGQFAITGKASTAGSVTRLQLTLVTTSGSGTVSGYNVTFKVTEKETFEVDDVNHQLVGKGSGKLKITLVDFGRSITRSIPAGYTYANLPDAVDGEWGLTVNPTISGTKYGGTGAIRLSNGKTYGLGVSGTYSAKNGASKFALKGTGGAKSISLTLTGNCNDTNLNILTLKGKALGQKPQYSD